MGQGHIRKGFFFYFGLLVLVLIAIFCICLVIMMFNPGKTVLWMQYFTANEHYVVSQTDDELYDIDMNFIQTQVDTIEINCTSYAEVMIQRNDDPDMHQEGIHIINKAKGFQGASGAVHFDCKVSYNNKVLTVDITEPNGFLNFSKEIKVVLVANTDTSNNFSHINLITNIVDGDFSVGAAEVQAEDVKLKSLTVKAAGKGDILIGKHFDTTSVEKMILSTVDGNISSSNTVIHKDVEYKGIETNCAVEISTVSGNIDLPVVNIGANDLQIKNEKGNVGIDYIKATNTKVVCKHGNYIFGEVDGNLNFAGANADTMITPNIKADYICGNFVIEGYSKAEPDISIGKIDGDVHVFADKGSLDINEAKGAVEVQSGDSFSVDVVVSENNQNTISIVTKSGNVKLGFLGEVKNAIIKTNTSAVNVSVTSVASFTATSKKNAEGVNDADQEDLENGNITVSIQLLTGESKNPLVVNEGTGVINVYTNSLVNYYLVEKSSLVA